MKTSISTYSPSENKAIKKIYCEILKEEWLVPNEVAQLEQDLDNALSEEVVLVARQNKTIVGFISWYEQDSFIHHLYVKKKYRGLGVGQELINCALDRLRYPVRLKCLKINQIGLTFYASNGWRMAGEGYSEDGEFFLLEFSKIKNQKIMMDNFKIHEKLQQDCYRLGRLPLCHLLLSKNAEVPWFILVPITNQTEVHELEPEIQKVLFQEVMETSTMLKNVLRVDKVNFGAIGNLVPQLHFHVIGRQVNDFCWPNVVWGAEGFRAYETDELQQMIGLVKSSFGSRLTVES